MRHHLLLSLLMVLCTPLTGLSEIRYTFTDLGGMEGYEHTWAHAVSDSGAVAGNASTDNGPSTALLFDETGAGHQVDLGGLGYPYSAVLDMNRTNMAVGVAWLPEKLWRATLFDTSGAGSNINLGTLPGGYLSSAYGVNDSGMIVGSSNTGTSGGSEYATVFDSSGNGNNLYLGSLSGYTSSRANDVSDTGIVVGSCGDQHSRATSFDTTGYGRHTDLGTLPFGQQSSATSVNDGGSIVGSGDNSAGHQHAVSFNVGRTGTNIDLGSLPGFLYSYAAAVNDYGQVVGECRPDDDDYSARIAVLFDICGNGQNYDLNGLVDAPDGWTLCGATSINNHGQIAGWGSYEGSARAFLLNPVTPPPHGGDANNDTVVDVGDLGILAFNWNQTPRTWRHGDFNGDCIVDVGDLGVLAFNWGWVGTPASQGGSVPEPAGLVLLVLGGLAVIHRRRK